jgi:hypothetical protein
MRTGNLTKNLKVTVQMSRMSCGDDKMDGYFHLQIQDKTSNIQILNVYISPEDVANLVSSRYTDECEAELCVSPNIGKKHENKIVTLDLVEMNQENLTLACSLWNSINGEGWKIDAYDMKWNSHRANHQEKKYTVAAFRFVDIP